jgi:hypothetical protein
MHIFDAESLKVLPLKLAAREKGDLRAVRTTQGGAI